MGIDMDSFVIRPQFAGAEGISLGGCRYRQQQDGDQKDEDSFHVGFYLFVNIALVIPKQPFNRNKNRDYLSHTMKPQTFGLPENGCPEQK